MIISPSLKNFEKGGQGRFLQSPTLSHCRKSPFAKDCQRGDLDLPILPLSKGRDLSHIEKNCFILSLQPDIKTIDRLAILFFASGNQCSTPPLVFDGRQHRVGLICRLITKINSCISVHEHGTRKDRLMYMRILYRWDRTRHSPWFHGVERETTRLVCARAAPTEKICIQRFLLLVVRMVVATVGVGLPDFDHRVRNGFSVTVENAPLDANPFSWSGIGCEQVRWFSRKP